MDNNPCQDIAISLGNLSEKKRKKGEKLLISHTFSIITKTRYLSENEVADTSLLLHLNNMICVS